MDLETLKEKLINILPFLSIWWSLWVSCSSLDLL